MSKLSTRSKVILAAVTVSTLAASGLAYATWTTGGSTTVTGVAGRNTNSFTVAQTSGDPGSLGGLTPAGPPGTIAYTVTNLTHVAQNVASDSVTLTVTPANGATTGCSTSDFDVTNNLVTGSVAADGSRSLGSVSVAMKSTAGDGCQGAGLSLLVSAA